MKKVKIKDLKVGEFFTLKEIEEPKESQVRIRGKAVRMYKNKKIYTRYSITNFDDINREVFMK